MPKMVNNIPRRLKEKTINPIVCGCCCLVAKSYLILLQPHGLQPTSLLCPYPETESFKKKAKIKVLSDSGKLCCYQQIYAIMNTKEITSGSREMRAERKHESSRMNEEDRKQ